MILDTRTILFLDLFTSTVTGLILVFAARGNEGAIRKSMGTWGLASLICAVSWVLLFLRGFIPDFVSIVVANALALGSVVEYYQAFRLFDGEKARRMLGWGCVALAACAVAYFSFVDNCVSARTAVGAFFVATVFAIIARRQFMIGKDRATTLRMTVGFLYCTLSGAFLFWGVRAVVLGRTMPAFLTNAPAELAVHLITAVGVTAIALTFLLMCNERVNAELRHTAVTDELTGLYNRRATRELAEREIAGARRSGRPLSLLMIDADRLKGINDTLGHQAGDLALVEVAQILRSNARARDIVGRFGGDEFAVVLPDADADQAGAMAARIASRVSSVRPSFGDREIHLSVSIGVATLDPNRADWDDLNQRADQELYAAKRRKA